MSKQQQQQMIDINYAKWTAAVAAQEEGGRGEGEEVEGNAKWAIDNLWSKSSLSQMRNKPRLILHRLRKLTKWKIDAVRGDHQVRVQSVPLSSPLYSSLEYLLSILEFTLHSELACKDCK